MSPDDRRVGGGRAIVRHLGFPTAGASLAPARGPHQAARCRGSASSGSC
ncbi:ATP-dependent helicase HrpA [Archangium violaceum]|nr:ATP-dependent helicase HrpA [Archangium violaceum]